MSVENESGSTHTEDINKAITSKLSGSVITKIIRTPHRLAILFYSGYFQICYSYGILTLS